MIRRGKSVHIAAGPLSYRERIEAHYAAHPTATLLEVYLATGAPRETVRFVRQRLVAAGRLHGRTMPDSLRAV
jgi:hypothetical protein